LRVQSLVDARKDSLIEKYLQKLLRANIEFLSQLANGDALRNRHLTRLAFNWRRYGLGGCGATCAGAWPGPHGMKFALALSEPFLDQRATTRLRWLPNIQWFARLGLPNWRTCGGFWTE
jgi:hypothetical protein